MPLLGQMVKTFSSLSLLTSKASDALHFHRLYGFVASLNVKADVASKLHVVDAPSSLPVGDAADAHTKVLCNALPVPPARLFLCSCGLWLVAFGVDMQRQLF